MTLSASTRGYYAIFTTFFLVLVIVVIVMGLMNYGTLVTAIKAAGKDQLSEEYSFADAKDKIFYCFGRKLDDLDNTCELTTLSGYRIRQLAYAGCEEKIVKEYFRDGTDDSGEYKVYIVAVTENRSCMGELEIYK